MYLFTLQKDNIRISDIMGCLQTKKNRMREGGGASMKQESENFFWCQDMAPKQSQETKNILPFNG